jgi:hypothetical protein
MKLPKDFKEFVELMISNNVRFVMIGATRDFSRDAAEEQAVN